MPFLVKVEADTLIELKKKLMNHLDLLDQLFEEAGAESSKAETSKATSKETANGTEIDEATRARFTEEAESDDGPPTRDDVANKIKEFVQKRGRSGIAGILAAYDAERLTDLAEKHYGDVIKALDTNLAKNEAAA